MDKTTARETRDGITTIKKSLYNFPKETHKQILDIAEKNVCVGDIYSDAISLFRKEYDKNKNATGTWIVKPDRKTGPNIQVWITKDANDDLEYLIKELRSRNTYVVYSAVLFYLQ